MAVIKGKGAPTGKTVGAVGDTYIDTRRGDVYKCMFAYSVGDVSDYEWEVTASNAPVKLVEVGPDINENDKIAEKLAPYVKEELAKHSAPKIPYNNKPQQRKYTKYRKENYNGKN